MNYAVLAASAAEHKLHVDSSGSIVVPLILQVPKYRRSTGERRLRAHGLRRPARVRRRQIEPE